MKLEPWSHHQNLLPGASFPVPRAALPASVALTLPHLQGARQTLLPGLSVLGIFPVPQHHHSNVGQKKVLCVGVNEAPDPSGTCLYTYSVPCQALL